MLFPRRYLSLAACALLLALGGCDEIRSLDQLVGGPTELSDKEKSLLLLGASMEKSGDFKGAEDAYQRAIEMSGGNPAAHLALADVYLQQGKDSQALKTLEQAYLRTPQDAKLNLALGKLSIRRNEAAKALNYFAAGLKGAPHDADLLNGQGIALDMQSKHKQAQKAYKAALDNAGSEQVVQIKNNLALSHIMSGKYDKAIALLEAMNETKDAAVLRQNLALAYGLKGDFVKAREWGGKDMDTTQLEQNIKFYQQYRGNLILQEATPQTKPAATGKPKL